MSQEPNKEPGPTPTSVRIERHFDVLPGKVWRGWTDPEVVRQWFGSDPGLLDDVLMPWPGTINATLFTVNSPSNCTR